MQKLVLCCVLLCGIVQAVDEKARTPKPQPTTPEHTGNNGSVLIPTRNYQGTIFDTTDAEDEVRKALLSLASEETRARKAAEEGNQRYILFAMLHTMKGC